MKEYQKIETLLMFDSEKRKFKRTFYDKTIQYLAPLSWYATEKIDGTNIRIYWNGKTFEIGGRTDKSQVPQKLLDIFQQKFNYDMEIIFEQLFGDKEVYLFMEGYGGKIQNGAYSCEERLIGYDVMINGYYIDKMSAKGIFEQLGLEFVPIFEVENLYDAIEFVKNHTNSILLPDNKMEGLVCVPTERIYDHQGNRVIVKIKNKDLMKVE